MTRLVSCLILVLFTGNLFAQELDIQKKGFFRKLDEIVLSQFTVSFVTQEAKSASTQSRWNFNGSTSVLGVQVDGLTETLMQKIADDARADFVAKATEAGYNVTERDIIGLATDWGRDQLDRVTVDNFKADCSHYQPFSSINDITVVAGGGLLVCPVNQSAIGYVGKEAKFEPVMVNYLLHVGYLEPKAKKVEDNFLGKIYNSTNVRFHQGLQVYWHSGLDLYRTHKRKAQIHIIEHFGSQIPPGELTVADSWEGYSRSSKQLRMTIDPDKYYEGAMETLRMANTKLVNALVANR